MTEVANLPFRADSSEGDRSEKVLEWMNEDSPHFEFRNAVRYWLSLPAWDFEEAVWIIAGAFRSPPGRPPDLFRFGLPKRFGRTSREALPAALSQFSKHLKDSWEAIGYDLSPQEPQVWIQYATETGHLPKWIALCKQDQSLRDWAVSFAHLSNVKASVSPAKIGSAFTEPQSRVDKSCSSSRVVGRPKKKESQNAEEKIRKMTDEELKSLSGKALAARVGMSRTWADERRGREETRRREKRISDN